jgi:hypothetical protein
MGEKMSKEQAEYIAKALATIVLMTVGWDEPLNGDDTELLVKLFADNLKELMAND